MGTGLSVRPSNCLSLGPLIRCFINMKITLLNVRHFNYFPKKEDLLAIKPLLRRSDRISGKEGQIKRLKSKERGKVMRKLTKIFFMVLHLGIVTFLVLLSICVFRLLFSFTLPWRGREKWKEKKKVKTKKQTGWMRKKEEPEIVEKLPSGEAN